MVVESSNRPEHKSHYFETTHALYELFDFLTNLYKYAATKTSAGYSGAPGPAGHNKIAEQFIVMKMPISPDNASSKTNTTYSTIDLALNGVSFFNENAAPGDQITNELFGLALALILREVETCLWHRDQPPVAKRHEHHK